MIESIRAWLLGVVCAAMMIALAECLVPEGNVKRVLRMAGGMALVLAAVNPVLKLDEKVLTEITGDYSAEAQEYREELQKTQDILYESIIAENAAAYISDKAKELGVACSVFVTVAWDDEVPCLQSVRVKGMWTTEQRELLRNVIERDLGIPEAMQYFEESEP